MIPASAAAPSIRHTLAGLRVSLEALPPLPTLEAWWRDLESRSDATLFTSWSWIGAWLHTLPGSCSPRLLVARAAGHIVGLGVVVPSRNYILKWIPSKCWKLNRSGMRELDNLMIEYNGILADRAMARAVRHRAIDFLLAESGRPCVDLGLADAEHAEIASTTNSWVRSRMVTKRTYVVDLDKVRHAPASYLSLLGPNTRSNVRRSMKAYASLGTLSVTEAPDLETAFAFLEELHALHAEAWQRRAMRTNFNLSGATRHFHTRLLSSSFSRGEIQLLRFAAGPVVIGYLYNFRYRDRVLYYQAGFKYGVIEKNERPGLVCHALAVEHNARQPYRLYDFLAGDQRYKASLATDSHSQAVCVVRRRGPMSLLDCWLRSARNPSSGKGEPAGR